MKNVQLILGGNITQYLLRHTVTIFIGLVCLSSLALVDMYFIGQLGSEELTAVSFGAPVLLFGINLLLSIGAALMIVASKLVGKEALDQVNWVSSAGIYLAAFVGGLLFILGTFGGDALFRLLQASEEIIFLLHDYMQLIYGSFIFLGIMVAATNIMRAFGEVRTPTLVMATVVACNLILDPLLIYGYGIIPAFGLEGAALATFVAILIGMFFALFQLRNYIRFSWRSLTYRWQETFKVAVPITISKTMLPTANAVITALLAGYSNAAVSAYGIGYRIDLLILLFMMALSIVVAPFVGQNYGAGNFSRIRACIRLSFRFAIIYGIVAAFLVILGRTWIGRIFTDDVAIIEEVSWYLFLVPWGYFLNGIYYIGAAVLDTLNRPTLAAIITFVHLFGLYIPLAYLGDAFWGVNGIYAAFPVSSLIIAIVMMVVVRKTINALQT